MMRPSRASTLPAYGGGGMSIPSGGEYGGGYARTSSTSVSSVDSYYSEGSSNSYGRGGFSGRYDDTFKDKPCRRDTGFSVLAKRYAKEPMAWATVVAVFFFFCTVHYRGERNWILRAFQVPSAKALYEAFHDAHGRLTRCRDDGHGMEGAEYELKHKVSDLEHELSVLSHERDAFKKQAEKARENVHHERIQDLTARDFAWRNQVEVLQNATQRESRRSTLELFGPGPHHVKFTVIYPTDEKETKRHFTVELAPLDLMPHTVHFFLQQVVHGLWNNAWFYLNGPHVLQGGPQASENEEDLWHLDHKEDDERAYAMREFRKQSLDHLAFPEYNERYPHVKWTLGYTGRPGGPDFYINKMDNTQAHGPGGQYQHDIAEYGDPCFGKVVDGFETLEGMYKEPTYSDDSEWGWFFEDPIHIVHAKILENAPLKIDVAEDNSDHSRKPAKILKKPKFDHNIVP